MVSIYGPVLLEDGIIHMEQFEINEQIRCPCIQLQETLKGDCLSNMHERERDMKKLAKDQKQDI